MNFNFPETKFMKGITISGQIEHVLSEAHEVDQEFKALEEGSFCCRLWDELMDLSHSLETLFRMAPDNAEAARLRVLQKNEDRGYYVPPAPIISVNPVKPANIVKVEDGYESLFKVLVEALNQAHEPPNRGCYSEFKYKR